MSSSSASSPSSASRRAAARIASISERGGMVSLTHASRAPGSVANNVRMKVARERKRHPCDWFGYSCAFPRGRVSFAYSPRALVRALRRRARPASTRERRAPARAYAIPTRSSRVRAPSSSPRAAVCAARASGSRSVLLRDEKRPRLPKRTAVRLAVCPSCRARPTRHASTPEVRRARYPPIRRASASLLPPHASVLGRARPVQRALARERFHRCRFLDDA